MLGCAALTASLQVSVRQVAGQGLRSGALPDNGQSSTGSWPGQHGLGTQLGGFRQGRAAAGASGGTGTGDEAICAFGVPAAGLCCN